MIRYQDSNREQRLPENIDIACFWDCNSFRSQPCIIPIAIEEGIWRVYGNFCSPECAAAFLFHERLDLKSDRYRQFAWKSEESEVADTNGAELRIDSAFCCGCVLKLMLFEQRQVGLQSREGFHGMDICRVGLEVAFIHGVHSS